MTAFAGPPGVFVSILPLTPPDTREAVFAHFDGRPVSAQMSAEAWAWYRRLCSVDDMQDCLTFEREAAKVALTYIIAQSALLRMR